jgi:hypothetical protein
VKKLITTLVAGFMLAATALVHGQTAAGSPNNVLAQLGVKGVTDAIYGTNPTAYANYLIKTSSNGTMHVTLLPPGIAAFRWNKVLFVDSVNGNDTVTNAGSTAAPYKTFAVAVSNATSNTVIVLTPGTYSAPTITNPLTHLVLMGLNPTSTVITGTFKFDNDKDAVLDVCGVTMDIIRQQWYRNLTVGLYDRARVNTILRQYPTSPSSVLTVYRDPSSTLVTPIVYSANTFDVLTHNATNLGYAAAAPANWWPVFYGSNPSNVTDALDQLASRTFVLAPSVIGYIPRWNGTYYTGGVVNAYEIPFEASVPSNWWTAMFGPLPLNVNTALDLLASRALVQHGTALHHTPLWNGSNYYGGFQSSTNVLYTPSVSSNWWPAYFGLLPDNVSTALDLLASRPLVRGGLLDFHVPIWNGSNYTAGFVGASNATYTPSVASNWWTALYGPVPDNVSTALDLLASRPLVLRSLTNGLPPLWNGSNYTPGVLSSTNVSYAASSNLDWSLACGVVPSNVEHALNILAKSANPTGTVVGQLVYWNGTNWSLVTTGSVNQILVGGPVPRFTNLVFVLATNSLPADFVPGASNTYNIGVSTNPWRRGYFGEAIYIDGALVLTNGATVPASAYAEQAGTSVWAYGSETANWASVAANATNAEQAGTSVWANGASTANWASVAAYATNAGNASTSTWALGAGTANWSRVSATASNIANNSLVVTNLQSTYLISTNRTTTHRLTLTDDRLTIFERLTTNFYTATPVAMDASKDGRVIYVTDKGGNVNVSTNYGVTWVKKAVTNPYYFVDIACDALGSNVVAVEGNFEAPYTVPYLTVAVSTNYGTSWSNTYVDTGVPDIYCTYGYPGPRVAMSGNGSVWWVAGYDSTKNSYPVYKSLNKGVTWSPQIVGGSGRTVESIGLSYDGSVYVVGVSEDPFNVTGAGVYRNDVLIPALNLGWGIPFDITVSDNGNVIQVIAVGSDYANVYLYESLNSGSTWNSNLIDTASSAQTLSANSTGSKLLYNGIKASDSGISNLFTMGKTGKPAVQLRDGRSVLIATENTVFEGAYTSGILEGDDGIINVLSHMIPGTSNRYDLGSAAYPYRDLYLSTGTLYMGGAPFSPSALGSTNVPVQTMNMSSNGYINFGTNAVDVSNNVLRLNRTAVNAGYATSAGTAALASNVTVGVSNAFVPTNRTIAVNGLVQTLSGNISFTTTLPVTNIVYTSTNVYTYANSGSVFRVTLTNNVILRNPTNGVDGQAVTWWVRQDAVGKRTVDLDTHFKVPTSSSLPLAWYTNANGMTMFAARYDAVLTNWYVLSLVPGY